MRALLGFASFRSDLFPSMAFGQDEQDCKMIQRVNQAFVL
jgi:hypothetical protein